MTSYIIILRHPLVSSRCHNLAVAAQVMQLDEGELAAMLDECGRVDTDEYTIIPEPSQ